MKKIQLYILILFVVTTLVIINACGKKFLDYSPQGSLNEETLNSRDGVYGLLVGTYASLKGWGWDGSPDNWVWGSLSSPDAHKGSDASDQPPMNSIMNWSIDPSNGFLGAIWGAMYEGVTRANSVLTVAQTANISDAERKLFMGEARFLRGFYYLELKMIFNMVPWIDEKTTDFKQPNDKDIWPNIEADFKYAMDNLDNTAPSVGRANKWAAAAFLAKVYLFQKKYPEAKTLFTDVIKNGVTSQGTKYDLLPSFSDNWRPEKENGAESVFAIQMTANDQSGGIDNANRAWMLNFPYGGPFGCCGFYQPSFDLINSFRVDANGLPMPDSYNSVTIKNDQGINSKEAYTPDITIPIDPRLDWTAGRRGLPYHDWQLHPGMDWIRDQSYAGPFSPKKNVFWKKNSDANWDKRSWAPGSSINVLLIRFADVLLMAAEAEAQTGGLPKALEYVNRVRERAAKPEGFLYKYIDDGNPDKGFSTIPAANYQIKQYPLGYFTNKDVALKAIYFERKLELAMEGFRFFDLVRWGEANKQINDYYAFEGQKLNDIKTGRWTTGKNEYFPIPLGQIDVSKVGDKPTLKQNPNY